MLELKKLRKTYGQLIAVESSTFELAPGDVFGFIGSNGAGKTTTIRMLATLLEPTSGTASLDGFDILRQPQEVRRRIGFVPDFFGFNEQVKVWEYLDFFGALYELSPKKRETVIGEVLELTDLTVKRDAFVTSLSRGMQQRLSVARCLLHDPKLLLLDEPASGLDPRARAELKELISELGRMGKIVVISSHILPELAGFCNVVGIIEQGRMVAFGPVDDIVGSVVQHKILRIRTVERAADLSMFLHGQAHVVNTNFLGPGELTVEFEGGPMDQAELLKAAVEAGFAVTELRQESADLEDVFLKVTTGAVN